MHILRSSKYGNNQSGVSLVEVMVALLVMGVGIMGFVALQLRSVETTAITYSRSQAMAIAQDIVERINVNPDGWPDGYDESDDKWTKALGTAPVDCLGPTDVCDVTEIAQMDVFEVRSIANAMLFDGDIRVEDNCGGQSVACVKVAWEGTSIDSCDPTDVSIEGSGDNGNCIIVEFWPQRAILALPGNDATEDDASGGDA